MTIQKPTLIVDKEKCLSNIQMMAKKASSSEAILRPHFKTHHSAEIASWFRKAGINQCTVSSVSMAEYFSKHGWDDMTIAFPYNPLESKTISSIARHAKLNILIESAESLKLANENIDSPIGYFIKIDVGTHRTGIDPRNEEMIEELIKTSNDRIQFKGFLAHAGHTYGAKDVENVKWIYEGAKKVLTDLKAKFGGILSYGDTPSCSLMEDFSAFDELRPGNFIFYDLMQYQIGSCHFDQIAICMVCPIVAIHPERNELVIYGGAVHFSKESLTHGKLKTYGKAVSLVDGKWGNIILGDLERISQEHGVIKMTDESLTRVKVGDLIGVIPVHSCLTADLQGHYLSTAGERIDKIIKD